VVTRLAFRAILTLPAIAAVCLGIATSAVAADVRVTANSILRTYADYCDPSSFERLGGQDNWDPDVASSYARVLMTKYLSNCDRFFADEVQPAAMVDELIVTTPQLQRDAPTSLTKYEIQVLGGARRIRDMLALNCEPDAEVASPAESVAAQLEQWAPQLVRADAMDYATGYVSFENLARYAGNIPTDMHLEPNCGYLKQLSGMVAMSMVNHGIELSDPAEAESPVTDRTLQSSSGLSQQEFERWANSGPETQPTVPVEPSAANSQQQSASTNYVWEPGDPSTNRGGDDEPTDLTPYVSPTDAATIAKLAGRWERRPPATYPAGSI
jgi:hypothetical protein